MKDFKGIITDEIFLSYLSCKYKSFLKLHGQVGSKTDFEKHQKHLQSKVSLQAQSKLCSSFGPDDVLSIEMLTKRELTRGKPLILNSSISVDNLFCTFDALKKVSLDSSSNPFHYVPVLYRREPNILANDKLLLAYKLHVLSQLEANIPLYGHIVCGLELRDLRVHLEEHVKKTQKIISELKLLAAEESDDNFFLNSHCEVCEFSEQCFSKAIDRDCLSLLRGMSVTEIKRHNEKGIFTVNQLSYTFRPRKTPKRAKNPATPHHFSLQALAIRENKIYIHGKPPLICSEFPVFFDIEGIPQRHLHYLIGILTMEGNEPVYRSFWANDEQDQANIVEDFLGAISDLEGSTFYHFGSYDKKALNQLRSLVSKPLQDILDEMLRRSQNLLSVIYPHVYFPTYTNRLKEIGRFLGCKWTVDNPSGVQSIMWREAWEETSDATLKERLLQYNKEDCLALKRVYDFIRSQTAENAHHDSFSDELSVVAHTTELKRSSFNNSDRPLFRKAQFLLDDLQFVNKCAYFDYQREKVYVREHQHFKRKAKKKLSTPRPNKSIKIESTRCIICNKKKHLKREGELIKDIIDLKFSKTGVKKWILRYISWHYHCYSCGNRFVPPEWPIGRNIYGHSIKSWCIYQNVLRKQNMNQVYYAVNEIFGNIIHDQSYLYRFRTWMAEYYQNAYAEILNSILNSPSIHIDETTIRLRKSTGYVWVITNMNMVYYFYKASREGSFLKEMLVQYKGVLISDFYTAYDSIDCPQQKCLIHLIRDINDTLKTNPFDNEFKKISTTFSEFLRSIIETIDHYGLKKRHLHKHKRNAWRFLAKIDSASFSSKIAQKLQRRINKSGMKLFTFLDYDGIPWNNNNAEHAMHSFAKHRQNSDGRWTQDTIEELLVLMSIFETCEFNNMSIMKFLLSKEKSILPIINSKKRKI